MFIDGVAFSWCFQLTNITWPSLQTIGYLTFYAMNAMTSFALPPKVTSLYALSIVNAAALVNLSLPQLTYLNFVRLSVRLSHPPLLLQSSSLRACHESMACDF
jgi:hypothetical protein